MAAEVRKAGFGRAMHTEQYSSYHTEGEKVADHYRFVYYVLTSIILDRNPQELKLLPVEYKDALRDLDPSVKRTVKEFPTLMRYIVMTHDIAKQPESLTINPKLFTLPEGEDSGSLAGRYAARRQAIEAEIAAMEVKRKELQTQEKAAKKDPQKLAPLKAEREALAADIESKKNEIAMATRKLYDDLLASGMGSKAINERYGLGAGFHLHEKASADMIRQMDIPDDLKTLLSKLAEDHVTPLNAFSDLTVEDKRGRNKDGSYKKSEERACGELFRDNYKGYSDVEVRLSTAMAALDILGSVPKGGKPDLTVVRRMIAGRREGFVMDGVDGDFPEAFKEYMAANHPELVGKDLAKADQSERDAYRQAKETVERSLRDKYVRIYAEAAARE